MADFSFVVNSSYDPFTLQEMLIPMAAYKEAYDKAEKESLALSEKANAFDYLSKTLPEDSEARQAYEKYANDLAEQAKSFSQYGYYRDNADALTSLKRRFSGEIGGLMRADEALKKAQETRAAMNAKDNTILYGNNNLTIDDFYNGKTPNLYNVSGSQLYAQGLSAGKAASSRVIHTREGDVTLGGYYRDFVQENGYSPETVEAIRKDINSNPELAQTFAAIKEQYGTDENLGAADRKRADASILNGIIDGIIHSETHNPTKDLGVLSAYEQANIDLEQSKINAASEAQAIKEAAASAAAKGKVLTYSGINYINNGGAASKVEAVDPDATKVNVTPSDGKIKVSIGTGENEVTLGTINPLAPRETAFTLEPLSSSDLDKIGDAISHGISWTRLNHNWDKDYDPGTINQLGNTLLDIIRRETVQGLDNYNFYFYPDNAGRNNENGGFFIEALDRTDPLLRTSINANLFQQ